MSGDCHTIAITGASGFVGGFLARHFAAGGYRVLAFGRRCEALLPDDIVYRSWDITTPYPFGPEEGVAAVVHCAGSVSEWGQYEEMYSANVLGTENALAAFPNSELFVHISSASVYGSHVGKTAVREDIPYPASYLNPYSTTKMLGELAVKRSIHPNRVILRPHIIYGPGDTTLLPRMLKARRLGRLIVLGDGNNRLSLTHVGNIAHAVEALIGRQCGVETFNICDSRTDTLNRILGTLVETMGWQDRLLHINVPVARVLGSLLERLYRSLRLKGSPLVTPYVVEQMSGDFTMDISKARAMLGYRPKHEYPDGFREVRDWLERDTRITNYELRITSYSPHH